MASPNLGPISCAGGAAVPFEPSRRFGRRAVHALVRQVLPARQSLSRSLHFPLLLCNCFHGSAFLCPVSTQ